MATASLCDPCTEANVSVSATQYCSDCDERLCSSCAESHTRFKSFKSHHVIDFSSVDSNIPISEQIFCNVHLEMLLDYYWAYHELLCCRACIHQQHRKCGNVLPLEHASKDVQKSELFTNYVENVDYCIATLNNLQDSKELNLQRLSKTKSVITKQIIEIKSRLLKHIDNLECHLHAELSSLQREHEIKINKHKEEISKVLNRLKTRKNEIDFLKDHGSNNQLFCALHQHALIIKSAEFNVQQMVYSSNEIDIAFDAKEEIRIDFFGQLSETVKPCQIQFKSMIFQQTEIMTEQIKRIARFEKDTEVKVQVKSGLENLKDLAVTVDNKLLLTNGSKSDPKLYVYRDCDTYETEIILTSFPYGVVVIPCTDRAIVTLPDEQSIQFINTTKMTRDNKVNVGFPCFGITIEHQRVYVGGKDGIIKTLDKNGKILKFIKHGHDTITFMSYDDIRGQFIVRCHNKLSCINIDGTLVYSKDISGTAGVTLDAQRNVYYSDFHNSNIHRMSPAGENCMEILNKDTGINSPYGMCFNNDFSKLFVINNNYTSVFVYNCRY